MTAREEQSPSLRHLCQICRVSMVYGIRTNTQDPSVKRAARVKFPVMVGKARSHSRYIFTLITRLYQLLDRLLETANRDVLLWQSLKIFYTTPSVTVAS